MDGPFFPDPNESNERDGDRRLVGVFLLALAIMIGLTIFIYYSNLWQAAGKLLLSVFGD